MAFNVKSSSFFSSASLKSAAAAFWAGDFLTRRSNACPLWLSKFNLKLFSLQWNRNVKHTTHCGWLPVWAQRCSRSYHDPPPSARSRAAGWRATARTPAQWIAVAFFELKIKTSITRTNIKIMRYINTSWEHILIDVRWNAARLALRESGQYKLHVLTQHQRSLLGASRGSAVICNLWVWVF